MQIEKDMLPIVFAAEKFDQYTFDHSVTVQSGHKPLESILKKTLFRAAKRLQGTIMRLNRYNIEVVYTLLYLTDTLPRAFLSTNQVNGVSNTSAWYSTCQLLNNGYSNSKSTRPRMRIFNNCEQ